MELTVVSHGIIIFISLLIVHTSGDLMSEKPDLGRCIGAVARALEYAGFLEGYHEGAEGRPAPNKIALEYVDHYKKALEDIDRFCPDFVKTRSFYMELRSISKEEPPELTLRYHPWSMSISRLYTVLHELERSIR